jgi:methylated-DNA-protein-cysteine methyltransferase-like protein
MKSHSKSQLKKSDAHFFERVYEIVRFIPPGRVTSYGAIARCIGSPGASRMVGWAMNASHSEEQGIPAHRVVNRLGMLTGKMHFRHAELMRELLESEGISVENDRIVNFEKVFWDPYRELI